MSWRSRFEENPVAEIAAMEGVVSVYGRCDVCGEDMPDGCDPHTCGEGECHAECCPECKDIYAEEVERFVLRKNRFSQPPLGRRIIWEDSEQPGWYHDCWNGLYSSLREALTDAPAGLKHQ